MDRTSPTIGKLTEALCKAKLEMPAIVKDKTVKVRTKTGGEYVFEFASNDEITTKTTPTLAKHGLAIVHSTWPENGVEMLITTLSHTSGEWEIAKSIIKTSDTSNQAYGGGISFLKRYHTGALLNLAIDQDDDANGADGNQFSIENKKAPSKTIKVQPAKKELTAPVDPKLLQLKTLVSKTGTDMSKFEKFITWAADKAKISVDAYLDAALVNQDVAIQVGKRYTEALARKAPSK